MEEKNGVYTMKDKGRYIDEEVASNEPGIAITYNKSGKLDYKLIK